MECPQGLVHVAHLEKKPPRKTSHEMEARVPMKPMKSGASSCCVRFRGGVLNPKDPGMS